MSKNWPPPNPYGDVPGYIGSKRWLEGARETAQTAVEFLVPRMVELDQEGGSDLLVIKQKDFQDFIRGAEHLLALGDSGEE